MKNDSLIALMACVMAIGCRNTTRIEIPMLVSSEALPTHTQMSEQEAASLLEVTLPINVISFAGYEDGGTVRGTICDAAGKRIGFRRGPWVFEDRPIEYFLTFYEGRGIDEIRELNRETRERQIAQDDPRLKAFSVLCLSWVDSHFTKKEIRKIRKENDMSDKGISAGHILWLFRPE